MIKQVRNHEKIVRSSRKEFAMNEDMSKKDDKRNKRLIEVTKKLSSYSSDLKHLKDLELTNNVLRQQNSKLVVSLNEAKKNLVEQEQLNKSIRDLNLEIKKLLLENERLKKSSVNFVVTTPKKSSQSVKAVIRAIIADAKTEVLICSPWITYVLDEFEEIKSKNIKVKILTRFEERDVKNGSTDVDRLRQFIQKFNAEVKFNNRLHAKMVIVDGTIAVVSSANLTKSGLSVNYEAGIVLRDKSLVEKAIVFFNGVWGEGETLSLSELKGLK